MVLDGNTGKKDVIDYGRLSENGMVVNFFTFNVDFMYNTCRLTCTAGL